jgi:hypothetical protein
VEKLDPFLQTFMVSIINHLKFYAQDYLEGSGFSKQIICWHLQAMNVEIIGLFYSLSFPYTERVILLSPSSRHINYRDGQLNSNHRRPTWTYVNLSDKNLEQIVQIISVRFIDVKKELFYNSIRLRDLEKEMSQFWSTKLIEYNWIDRFWIEWYNCGLEKFDT